MVRAMSDKQYWFHYPVAVPEYRLKEFVTLMHHSGFKVAIPTIADSEYEALFVYDETRKEVLENRWLSYFKKFGRWLTQP